jgi:hypothetical protein
MIADVCMLLELYVALLHENKLKAKLMLLQTYLGIQG